MNIIIECFDFQEEAMENPVGIEFIRNDPSRLESMTVEELRKLTR